MGKFRIVYGAIDYTPTGAVEALDPTLNVSEVDIHTSPFTRKRDPILRAQYDQYGYLVHDISATDYEDVFKVILNQQVYFYPDGSDIENVYSMIITKAKPYYRNNICYKDSLRLEMIQRIYAPEILTLGDEILTLGDEILTLGS